VNSENSEVKSSTTLGVRQIPVATSKFHLPVLTLRFPKGKSSRTVRGGVLPQCLRLEILTSFGRIFLNIEYRLTNDDLRSSFTLCDNDSITSPDQSGSKIVDRCFPKGSLWDDIHFGSGLSRLGLLRINLSRNNESTLYSTLLPY
jgi:hypothetical protein